jgi:hypothetical protein
MTQCESKGMKSINVKMLMGHDIGVSGHYYRPTESDLLDDYLKHAVDSLTIDPTHRLQKQVSKLESEKTEEIARLRTELAKIKEDKEESSEQWEQMRHQIDKIRQKMGLV